MSFPTTIYGALGDRLVQTETQKLPLGTRLVLPDGRVFRYARAGASDLDIGKLMQECVVSSGHTKDRVPAVAAIGATQVTITNATTAITAGMYAEGYLFINNEAGEGQICTIKSHAVAGATDTCVITLEDEDALTVALTASSRVGLRKNLYKDIIVNPISATGVPIGVTPRSITAEWYGWLQTWGPCAVLTNGVLVLGKAIGPGGTTVGSVDVYPLNSVDASGQEPAIGWVMSVGATTEYSLVFLTIAP